MASVETILGRERGEGERGGGEEWEKVVVKREGRERRRERAGEEKGVVKREKEREREREARERSSLVTSNY